MIAERTCHTCSGREFQVTNGHSLNGTSNERGTDHWFCARCDWGADERRPAADGDEILT